MELAEKLKVAPRKLTVDRVRRTSMNSLKSADGAGKMAQWVKKPVANPKCHQSRTPELSPQGGENRLLQLSSDLHITNKNTVL